MIFCDYKLFKRSSTLVCCIFLLAVMLERLTKALNVAFCSKWSCNRVRSGESMACK